MGLSCECWEGLWGYPSHSFILYIKVRARVLGGLSLKAPTKKLHVAAFKESPPNTASRVGVERT